jgi:arylsulfatase A-like enzyme
MKKRILFSTVAILMGVVATQGQVLKVLGRQQQVQTERPNIVFMMCDDMRYDRIAALNDWDTDLQTPHLDQLVSDGMNFTRAYDTTPICSASRGQVFTGLYEFSTGCNFNRENEKKITIDDWMGGYAVRLRANGYRTAFGGKEHCQVYNYTGGKKQDFDRWFGFANGSGDGNYWMIDNQKASWWHDDNHWESLGDGIENEHETYAQALLGQAFIKECVQQHGDKPFMLSLNFKAPHSPLDQFDPRYAGVYTSTNYPSRSPNDGTLYPPTHLPPQAFSGRTAFKGGWSESSADNYNTLCFGIDAAVGMVRAELVDQGVADNTVIIFMSDNGYFRNSKGFGDKVYAYEEGSRTPMIVYDPRKPASHGQSCGAVCGNIDVVPTMLDLAGVDYHAVYDKTRPVGDRGYHGRSILPLLEDPNADIHDSMLILDIWNSRAEQHLAVVTREWKYINWFYSANGFSQSEELYHKDDTYENANVKGANVSVMNDLYSKYDSWLDQWTADATSRDRYVDYPPLMARGFNMSTLDEAEVKAVLSPKATADYVVHSGNTPNWPTGYTNQVTVGTW